MATVADIGIVTLYDATSGVEIPDDPALYKVLGSHTVDGYRFHVVQGPSDQLDVMGPDDGRLHRDTLAWIEELPQWVSDHYPSKASE
jgi:hypothetical protein